MEEAPAAGLDTAADELAADELAAGVAVVVGTLTVAR